MEKIFSTKEIWMSDITKMNDKEEYKSGYHVIQEELCGFGLENHDIVNEMSNDNLNKTFQILIGCFSRNGDLKSQWSEYADQARGVSIGFDEEEITQFNMFNRFTENGHQPINSKVSFIQVHYDEAQLRESAKKIIKRHIQSDSPIKWNLLAKELMYLSISYKDKFFKEESETRAVITLDERFDEKYLIGQRDTKYGVANYHKLNTSYQDSSSIKEVKIGPKCDLSIDDIKKKLEESEIDKVMVTKSIATGKYR